MRATCPAPPAPTTAHTNRFGGMLRNSALKPPSDDDDDHNNNSNSTNNKAVTIFGDVSPATYNKLLKERRKGRKKGWKKTTGGMRARQTAHSPKFKAKLDILQTFEDGNPPLRRLVLRKVIKYLEMDKPGADGTLNQQLNNIQTYSVDIDLPGLMKEITNEIVTHKIIYKFRK